MYLFYACDTGGGGAKQGASQGCAPSSQPPKTKGEIEFTPDAVQEHLDGMITFWRNKKKNADKDMTDHMMASCYIDCLQSLRKNLFGEEKP
jgi:hypothetical protein